jgi:hypothetical protein
MSIEPDRVFPQLLFPLAFLIFFVYLLKRAIKHNKSSFSEVILFLFYETIICFILLLVFSMCASGCDDSCPSYYFRPLMKLAIVILAILSCSMLIYLIELALKEFFKKSN